MSVRERISIGLAVLGTVLLLVLGGYWSRRHPHAAGKRMPWMEPLVERDLDAIAADTLRLLVLEDPLTWEQRPRAETGLEFELIERFAREKGLLLHTVPVIHRDSLFLWLQQGRGDIIAAQLSPRKEEKAWVHFTPSYRSVRPLVVRLRPDPLREPPGGAVVDAPLDSAVVSPWSPVAD